MASGVAVPCNNMEQYQLSVSKGVANITSGFTLSYYPRKGLFGEIDYSTSLRFYLGRFTETPSSILPYKCDIQDYKYPEDFGPVYRVIDPDEMFCEISSGTRDLGPGVWQDYVQVVGTHPSYENFSVVFDTATVSSYHLENMGFSNFTDSLNYTIVYEYVLQSHFILNL